MKLKPKKKNNQGIIKNNSLKKPRIVETKKITPKVVETKKITPRVVETKKMTPRVVHPNKKTPPQPKSTTPKIIIEKQTTTKSWSHIIWSFFKLCLIFMLFFGLCWIFFFQFFPTIGAKLGEGGGKIWTVIKELYKKGKNNVHEMNDALKRFYEKTCHFTEKIAKFFSLITPFMIGMGLATLCTFLPVIGPPISACLYIGTVIWCGLNIMSDTNIKTAPPTPPTSDVIVIDHTQKSKEQQEEKKSFTR